MQVSAAPAREKVAGGFSQLNQLRVFILFGQGFFLQQLHHLPNSFGRAGGLLLEQDLYKSHVSEFLFLSRFFDRAGAGVRDFTEYGFRIFLSLTPSFTQ